MLRNNTIQEYSQGTMMTKFIAWIEDDIDIIDLVVRPLEIDGYQIHRYYTVQDALSNIHQIRRCDLILVDLILPSGNLNPFGKFDSHYPGLTLLHELRTTHFITQPAIVLSVVANASVNNETKNLGVANYLNKPVLPSVLKKHVENAIKKFQKKNTTKPVLPGILEEQVTNTVKEFPTVRKKSITPSLQVIEQKTNAPSVDTTRQNRGQHNSHKPLKIFLCHASEDKVAVRNLYAKLKSDGFDPWVNQENILPGQNWKHEIEKALIESDITLVCLSNNSVNKTGFVQKEIRIALDAADERPENLIYLIPARLEDCDVPTKLIDKQWVDLYDKEGYPLLIKALHHRARNQ